MHEETTFCLSRARPTFLSLYLPFWSVDLPHTELEHHPDTRFSPTVNAQALGSSFYLCLDFTEHGWRRPCTVVQEVQACGEGEATGSGPPDPLVLSLSNQRARVGPEPQREQPARCGPPAEPEPGGVPRGVEGRGRSGLPVTDGEELHPRTWERWEHG